MSTDVIATARRAINAPLGMLDELGEQMSFYARALAWTPRTIRRYKKETLRLLSEVAFRSGAPAIIGGGGRGLGLPRLLTRARGGLPGYAALDHPRVSAPPAFIQACFDSLERAPLVPP